MAPDMLTSRERPQLGEFFRKFARKTADVLGRAEIFLAALAAIMIWAALGPIYNYSDT
jgi:low affinity Fe/Cu permease